MKTPTCRCLVPALAFLICSVCTSQTQEEVFTFSLAEPVPPGIGSLFAGFGSFTMDANAGLFQVNVVYPYDGDIFTASIVTPSGSLPFWLGTGTPTTFPVGSFGDFMYGVQYAGSLQSSAAAYSDLLSGLGEFRLASDMGVQLVGALVQTVPEPGACVLLIGGLMLLLCLRLQRTKRGWNS